MESPKTPRAAASKFEEMARYFRALSEPNRVELLSKLRLPRAAAEIQLSPSRADRERDPDRPISKHAVEKHLANLQALGLVRARPGLRDNRPVVEYVVNTARLFVVLEHLRRLTFLNPLLEIDTVDADGSRPAEIALPDGPCLVLVNGPPEGIAFPLAGDGPWRIGRRPGLDIPLAYDPFVSLENTEVFREGEGFRIRPLPDSRNGTRLNWRPLTADSAVPLRPSDVVGVGRSLLLFRTS